VIHGKDPTGSPFSSFHALYTMSDDALLAAINSHRLYAGWAEYDDNTDAVASMSDPNLGAAAVIYRIGRQKQERRPEGRPSRTASPERRWMTNLVVLAEPRLGRRAGAGQRLIEGGT
jgi:hypothetical protein